MNDEYFLHSICLEYGFPTAGALVAERTELARGPVVLRRKSRVLLVIGCGVIAASIAFTIMTDPSQQEPRPAAPMRIRIATAHPSLPGHVPGNPVVPGALLLAEIEERLATAGLQIVAVRRARFMQRVRPGDVVEVECRVGSSGERRFECRVGDEVVVRGSLEVASPNEGQVAGHAGVAPNEL
jgi:3-hydroxyacyl-[acyl-carrier-protein] dehydratase